MAQPIWNTFAENLVGFVSGSILEFQFSASPVLPATSVSYSLVGGTLPNGVTIDSDGLMYGLTEPVFENKNYTFVVRATDNLGNIRDKTFTMLVSGIDAPDFTTPTGTILVTNDSLWVEYPIQYSVPVSATNTLIALVQGQLPPGLEINEFGLIRGYPKPPVVNVNLGSVNTAAIATLNNTIVCYSTLGFRSGRPIVFTNSVIGGVTAGQTYFVREVIDNTTFTISTTVGGPVYELINQVGYMDVSLPNVSIGQPTIQTYDFTLRLVSDFGTALQTYAITVVNQNAPVTIGGPGKPPNSRTPSILNTRPLTYDIRYDDLDYSFYLFPPNSRGETYAPAEFAYIGKLKSDNEFSFQILGKDFDDGEIEYVYADLPLGLVGDPVTGWITGNPIINPNNISESGAKSKHTSYSVNKGEKIIFCLRQKNEEQTFVDENTVMFVAIHELAHIMTLSIGHEPEFWNNFKVLLKEAVALGIYQKEDYSKNPKPYCGITVSDNPLYNL